MKLSAILRQRKVNQLMRIYFWYCSNPRCDAFIKDFKKMHEEIKSFCSCTVHEDCKDCNLRAQKFSLYIKREHKYIKGKKKEKKQKKERKRNKRKKERKNIMLNKIYI